MSEHTTTEGLTGAEQEALWESMRRIRVEDGSPVSILKEHDEIHALWTVVPTVERILADRLAAVQAELAHERQHVEVLREELDADAKHAALAEGESCDVCTHLESEQVQAWMAADLDWQDRAETAEAERDAARAEVERLRSKVWALGESIYGEEGVEHNEGCEGEPDCLACIVADLRAALDADHKGDA